MGAQIKGGRIHFSVSLTWSLLTAVAKWRYLAGGCEFELSAAVGFLIEAKNENGQGFQSTAEIPRWSKLGYEPCHSTPIQV